MRTPYGFDGTRWHRLDALRAHRSRFCDVLISPAEKHRMYADPHAWDPHRTRCGVCEGDTRGQPGHGWAAHRLFGACSIEHSPEWELTQWRGWAALNLDRGGTDDQRH